MLTEESLEIKVTLIELKIPGMKFRVTDQDARDVYALLRIIRQEEIRFEAFFRYQSNDKPVVRDRRKREVNFTDKNLKFSYDGIKEYIEQRGIKLNLPKRYHELKEKECAFVQQHQRVSESKLPYPQKRETNKQTRKQISDVTRESQSLYVETALREVGYAWMKTLPDRVKTFAEQDGRTPEYGGTGGGPYLINWLRFYTLPKNKMAWGFPVYPGSYGSGKRK